MVSIAAKAEGPRMARSRARVRMQAATLERIRSNTAEKGDVLAVARLAAISAAKQTSALIPLCHPVRLTAINVSFRTDPDAPAVEVEVEVHAIDRTGPEMEAMIAASMGALTIYDMCKAMDRGMEVESVVLLEKSGGRSGHWRRP
jgi:cyclic pyranopterin phosphate synthase